MSVFTEDQMHRPLFEEPSAALERHDKWSEPFGFMVGGMANTNYQHLGQQYYNAACSLVESIKYKDVADCEIANPVLYLYRHSIELFLKAAMGGAAKTHSLETLADEYRIFIDDQFAAVCPKWITDRMKELGAIDPNSTAFRYSMNFDKATRADIPVDGEYHVNLDHLQSVMSVLVTALVGTIAAVACGEGRVRT